MPVSASILMPVYFLSRMKLATPATASEPYAAEAPPVTISTVLISACGKVLMSTSPVIVDPTERRPSSSTSVRTSPRLRRLSVLTPASPELIASRELAGRVLPASAGCWLMKSARLLVGDWLWISCCDSTESGVGERKPSRTMRLPVTTICSSVPTASAVEVVVEVWANAGAALIKAIAAAAVPNPPELPNERRILPRLRIKDPISSMFVAGSPHRLLHIAPCTIQPPPPRRALVM